MYTAGKFVAIRTIFFAFAAASLCYGQGTVLKEGSVITGQCTGNQGQPGCVLPTLFGSNGLTLANNPVFPHFAHFAGAAASTLNVTLSSAIATQFTVLPIISPSSGFTYKYDSAAGAFVRTSTGFGPIYTERAETIGRGKFSFGASYQRFHFSSIDGIDLHRLPAVFSHIPGTGTGGIVEPYEADVLQTTNSVDLHMDQSVLYGTVGVTDRVDVSVAVPIVSVRVGASSFATINRVSGDHVTLVGGPTIPNPHLFANGSLTNVYSNSGSATGIGDVTIRAKANVHQGEAVRVALALDVRTPSGNAREWLGSGAVGIKPFVIVSTPGRFSPHVNVGYQWNGSSILAGDITGTTFSEGVNPANGQEAVFYQTGPAVKQSLPSDLFYSGGVDIGASKRLTLAFDYLGHLLINAPRVFQTPFSAVNPPGGTGSSTLQTLAQISGGKDNFGLSSGAAGFKYNLSGRLLFSADVLFRLDNKGLRQDVTPLVSLSYAFGEGSSASRNRTNNPPVTSTSQHN